MRFILFNLVVAGALAYLIAGGPERVAGASGAGGEYESAALADCAERVADTVWDTGEALLAVANERLGGEEGIGRDMGDRDRMDPSSQSPERPLNAVAGESAPAIEAAPSPAPAPVYEPPYDADVPSPILDDTNGWRDGFLAALGPFDIPMPSATDLDGWRDGFLAAMAPIEVPDAAIVEAPDPVAPAPVAPEPAAALEFPHVDPANILPVDDPAVIRRRAEVLGYDTLVEVAQADAPIMTDRAQRLLELDPATFMSQDERRRELMRLAQDMDDLFANKLSR